MNFTKYVSFKQKYNVAYKNMTAFIPVVHTFLPIKSGEFLSACGLQDAARIKIFQTFFVSLFKLGNIWGVFSPDSSTAGLQRKPVSGWRPSGRTSWCARLSWRCSGNITRMCVGLPAERPAWRRVKHSHSGWKLGWEKVLLLFSHNLKVIHFHLFLYLFWSQGFVCFTWKLFVFAIKITILFCASFTFYFQLKSGTILWKIELVIYYSRHFANWKSFILLYLLKDIKIKQMKANKYCN